MSVTEINICKTIARFGILAFFCFGILARCASVGTPQGGPRDSLPPKVVMMTPAFGTTNFKDNRITIQFNEYVQLKEQEKAIKERKQFLENLLKESIGDHKGLQTETRRVTWSRSTAQTFDQKALKEQQPDIFSKFVKTTPKNNGLRISARKDN